MSHQIEADRCERFAREFFASNPGASVHKCLKSANNARPRIHPQPVVVARVHQEMAHAKLAGMLDLPAKTPRAEEPQPIIPDTEEEESMPAVAPPKPHHQMSDAEKLAPAVRAVLDAMNNAGMESLTLMIDASKTPPKVSCEVEYRRRNTFEIDL